MFKKVNIKLHIPTVPKWNNNFLTGTWNYWLVDRIGVGSLRANCSVFYIKMPLKHARISELCWIKKKYYFAKTACYLLLTCYVGTVLSSIHVRNLSVCVCVDGKRPVCLVEQRAHAQQQ